MWINVASESPPWFRTWVVPVCTLGEALEPTPLCAPDPGWDLRSVLAEHQDRKC